MIKIKAYNTEVLLFSDNILYIEPSMNGQTSVVKFNNGSVLTSSESLSDIEQKWKEFNNSPITISNNVLGEVSTKEEINIPSYMPKAVKNALKAKS